jgi:PhnB protein
MHVPKLEPYLSFDGNCAEAFAFYEHVLGAKIAGLTTFADRMKDHSPPSDANKVMHGVLHVGSQVIRASDRTTEQPYEGIKGCWLSIDYPTAAAATEVFASLSEGGVVSMPIDKTFWAAAFGMVTDRFGVPWMVSCNGHD